jgi:hypothetical protein
VSFAAISLCIASQRVFVVDFIIDSVRKLLDTPSYFKILSHDLPAGTDAPYKTARCGCGYEIFTAVKIRVAAFWVVTSCSDVVGYQRFGELCCLRVHNVS